MDDRKRVIRAIREAFAGADRPAPPFVGADTREDSFRAELEDAFARQDELDPAFIKKHIFSAHHLVADAFRWFVRSLLLELVALDWSIHDRDPMDDSAERALIHTAVYWLRPNPIAVRQNRIDYQDAIRARLRLGHAERVAVAQALHLLIASPSFTRPSIPHLASQAIAWCWRDDPAATEAAARFRAAARSYLRPSGDTPDLESLLLQIETAFADTPPPASPLLTFLDEEGSDYELELTGARWQTLEPWLVSQTSTAFCWMTPSAFRYFLPAALRAQLLGVAGNADPEFHIVNCLTDPSWRSQTLARIHAFSPAERKAIVAYLRWRSSDSDRLREALAAWAAPNA